MLVGIFQSAVFLITVIAFYGMDFLLIRRYDRQRQASGSGRSWDFTMAIFVAVVLLLLQPILLPQIGWQTSAIVGLFIQITGIILLTASLSLHAWSRIHLQHFYAERVEIQPNHQVIDSGPYAFVRHPVITSFFGFVTGLFLVNPALTTLAMMAYVFWDFSRAARQEEELLSKNLPDYQSYMARTPRFLPRLRKS